MNRSAIFCLFLGRFFQLAMPEALLSVRFLTFRNPRGHDDRGRCCDETLNECSSPCDHSFTICLDQMDGPVMDINHCTYGHFVSLGIQDANYINFGDKIANLANPLLWRFRFWPGQVLLKIDVEDMDPLDAPDHVAYLHKIISAVPVNSRHGSRIAVSNTVELTLEARVSCGRHHYGLDCGTYCKPKDNHVGHYTCNQGNGTKICLPGWVGEECSTNRDDCNVITCQNGGICLDLLDTFQCQCPPGFEGRFCDGDINECSVLDVCNHGDCLNTAGSFICACHDGWVGEECSTNRGDCTVITCQNGGICLDLLDTFQCQCPPGFEGRFCDGDINECSVLDVCNHGDCLNTAGSVICACHDGWVGEDCSTNRDDCTVITCQNGGICLDLLDTFQCQCPPGFEGRFCEGDINECSVSNVCNHGDCHNVPGSFICTCHDGYTGTTCSHNLNNCKENPCKHGGVCVNHMGRFECSCRDGFTGEHCESNISECLNNVCKHHSSRITMDKCLECACPELCEWRTYEQNIMKCLSCPCIHFEGGFVCICSNETLDFDEELKNEHGTGNMYTHNFTCLNSFGNFTCRFSEIWKRSRFRESIDERQNVKPLNKDNCFEIEGRLQCECHENWTGAGYIIYLNKCELSTHVCRYNATCHNMNGTFCCLVSSGCVVYVRNEYLDKNLQDEFFYKANVSTSNGSSIPDSLEHVCGVCVNTELGQLCPYDKDWLGLCCLGDVSECPEIQLKCWPGETSSRNKTEAQSDRVFLQIYQGCNWCVCAEGWSRIKCGVKLNDSVSNTPVSADMSGHQSFTTALSGRGDEATILCMSLKHRVGSGNTARSNVTTTANNSTARDNVTRLADSNRPHDNVINAADSRSALLDNVTRATISTTDLDNVTRATISTTALDNVTRTAISTTALDNVTRATISTTALDNVTRATISTTDLDNVTRATISTTALHNVTRTAISTTDLDNVTRTADINIDYIFDDMNTTFDISGQSELSVPFILNCQISAQNSWMINQALEQLFRDTDLFVGKELAVHYKSEQWAARDGHVVTSVMPIISVDGETLSVSETIHVMKQAPHTFSHYFRCPHHLVFDKNVTFSALPYNSNTQDWYPGVVTASILIMILLLSLILLKYWRTRMRRKRMFKVRSVEVSSSFRKKICRNTPETTQQTNDINKPAAQHASKPIINKQSRTSASNMASEPSGFSEHGQMESASECCCVIVHTADLDLMGVPKSRVFATPTQVTTKQDTKPASTYTNLMDKTNRDEDVCAPLPGHRHHHSSNVDMLDPSYIQMLGRREFNAEVYASRSYGHSQLMNRVCQMTRKASDVEYEKYKALPYIDDPAYMHVTTIEGQLTPPNVEHV